MATIAGTTINHGITLATSGTYASPLTITTTGAVVASTGNAIFGPASQAWTVDNQGRITAAAGDGVKLLDGGSVTNGYGGATAAVISGYLAGIYIDATTPTTVANYATITAGANGVGVLLNGGGTITNGSTADTTALISSGYTGVEIENVPGTVVNFATIVGTAPQGAVRLDGGVLVNGATGATGAVISGRTGVAVYNAGGSLTLTNYGTITVTGTSGRPAVKLTTGTANSITNFGPIAGGTGIYMTGAIGTVTNTGTITGTVGGAIVLEAGGSVTNAAAGTVTSTGTFAGNLGGAIIFGAAGSVDNAGLISGVNSDGVYAGGAAVTLTNTGTITSPQFGVYLTLGGYVSNSASGLIQGNYGVIIKGAAGTVTNSATIVGTTGGGVVLHTGGTVVDSGTISSGNGTAVEFAGTAGNLLVLEHGYKLVGRVDWGGSPATNTLELAGSVGAAVTVGYNGLTEGILQDALFGTGGNDTFDVSNTSGTLPATISGFALNSDVIDLTAIGNNGSITSQTSTEVTVTGSSGAVTLLLDPSDSTNLATVSDGATGTDLIPCFQRGTLIHTETGEVAVEQLAIGDKVTTLSGAAHPIKWIGRRAYDPRFVAGNRAVLPIRIEAGVLGDGIPARDLFVSPEHALHIDGVLVPARLLVNGITIRQVESVERLEYFHIELDGHDLILADGAAAETFVDCDNRFMFHNAGEFAALYPGEQPQTWKFCAPRVAEDSAELTAIRRALLARATSLGRTSADPGLHLIADGEIVRAASGRDRNYRFEVVSGTRSVALVSRSAVPAEVYPNSLDGRALGVAVERIVLCGAGLRVEIGHDCPALSDGFHDDEASHRWSDGRGCLPEGILASFAGAIAIEVHLAETALIYPALSPATAADPDATDDPRQSASAAAPARDERPAAAAEPSGSDALLRGSST